MSRPFVIGLTGSIGMGKSTTARMFADLGADLWDADAAVHRLYGPGGAAVGPVGALCPEAVQDGALDRTALKAWIARDPGALPALESIVHPLVAADRAAFIAASRSDIVVVDVPLLFETGGEGAVDMVVVVTTDPKSQRERVLERGVMSEADLDRILARQLPDAEKRARADQVIRTDTLETAQGRVAEIVGKIRKDRKDA